MEAGNDVQPLKHSFLQLISNKMDKRDVILCSASALTASTVAVLVYRYFSQRSKNVYETEKLVQEYLIFHYGKPREVLSYNYGPADALDFPVRCADVCRKFSEVSDFTWHP